ncbi:MAG: NAD(P)/FAD-dependent oxidoreductase [Methanoregulaceae archaeon]|nr:NAD(P)/FAD-dependent oxidoreductase [Methanoregulaceae archaeon]
MTIILGGGPAGRIAAIHLADAGEEVRLVEGSRIGGQCLHFGCMLVCGLNDAARVMATNRQFRDLGVLDTIPALDFPRLMRELKSVQETISVVLDSETKAAGVDIVYGCEAGLNGNVVLLGDEILKPDSVIVATGSRPAIPDIPGTRLDRVYTPHTIPAMKDLPDSLAIIGGGIMAAEFAYIFRTLGSEVHLLSRSGLLRNLDPHLRAAALRELGEVNIMQDVCVKGIEGNVNVEAVRIATGNDEKVVHADAVLIAAGLIPRSEKIQGIRKGPAGELIVDSRMRTSMEGVYAAGDVTGPPYLTPVARREGTVAAENILGRDCTMDYRYIPQSMNLATEFGFVGGAGSGALSMSMPGPAGPGTFWQVPFRSTGISKVSIGMDDGRIIGAASAGPGSGTIAGYVGFLIQNGFTAHDLSGFMEVHPSTDGIQGLLKYAGAYLRKRQSGTDSKPPE